MEKEERVIGLRVFLTTIILLGILILFAGIATYIVPSGELTDAIVNGKHTQIYKIIEQTPVPIWKIAISPVMSITGTNGAKIIVLILFILFIGGSFAIMNKSGVLPGILTSLVRQFSDRKRLFIIINVCLFSFLGSTMGILEEMVPLILIFVPLAYRMGWDSVTGAAIPFLSSGFGFAAATFNPFTVGTAQKLADVPLFTGLEIRIPFFFISTLCVVLYLLYYTNKIEKNPEKSPTYAMDKKIKATLNLDQPMSTDSINKAPIIWMLLCFFLIAGVVIGGTMVQLVQDLSFPLIALIFLLMGFGAGFLSGGKIKEVFAYFAKGLTDFAPAILLILMAAAVGYLIEEGNILDTILYSVSQASLGLGKEAAILMIYGFQILMNALVPSGTGQAVLTIPILAPLGDLLGISRQTVVLAFQFGDGFSNLFWPTNAMLLIAIGLARINYREWFRFILPIQLILLILCSLTLLLAVNINFS
ncbi:TIGR00366 family protein [bacterium]|nr:TIGR00366 family protein [bacterium]